MKNVDKIKEMITIAEKKGVIVDRWGNIKWDTSTGKTYRYKIKKNVVRNERYIPNIKEWVRIDSYSIKSFDLHKWGVCMGVIKRLQEGW